MSNVRDASAFYLQRLTEEAPEWECWLDAPASYIRTKDTPAFCIIAFRKYASDHYKGTGTLSAISRRICSACCDFFNVEE